MRYALGLVAVGMVWSMSPVEAGTLDGVSGIQIVPAGEVLEHHAELDPEGTLWFLYPNGARVPFITSPTDPQIVNAGDGAFHPVGETDVTDAVTALTYQLVSDLEATVFILPFPRAGLLSSSADDRAIYLSPGVLEYEAHQAHFLVAHEMGHIFQRRYLPSEDQTGWSEYRELRGIEDESIYYDGAPHADRPREVFAEDFRALFGGALAQGDGSIENQRLVPPKSVAGLEQWMKDRVGSTPQGLVQWVLFPNPAGRGQRMLSLRGPSAEELVHLSLLDVAGRRLQTVEVNAFASGSWTVQLPAGLASGSYWVELTHAGGEITHLPLRWVR